MQEYQYALDILKEFFTLAVINQMHKSAPLWAQFRKKVATVFGRRIVIPVQLGFTEAVGARAPNDYSLPEAGRNLYDRAYIEIMRNYGRVSVDGLLVASSKGAGGFVEAFSQEMKGVSFAEGIDLDRQSFMDGSGSLALCKLATPTGQIMTLEDAGGITGNLPGKKFIRKGMVLDVWTTGWDANHAVKCTVKSIDDDETITFEAVDGTDNDISAVVAGDILVRHKTFSIAGGWGEQMGLDGIVNDVDPPTGKFEDIERATVEEWKAWKSTTSAVITEDLMMGDLDDMAQQTDGHPPTFALTTYALRRKLAKDAKTAYKTESLELKAGWKGIKFVGGEVELPIMAHRFVPYTVAGGTTGYMYYVSEPHIKFYALKKLVWDTSGGGTIKPVAGEDVTEAWFKMYGNLGTDCSNVHGVRTAYKIA